MNRIWLKSFASALIASILLSLVTGASAAKSTDYGLALYAQAPALSARDTNGKPISIAQLSGEKGLILIFFRSADWCPFCKRHLLEVNQGVVKLNTLGYGVAGISYDSIATLSAFSQAEQLQFPLIADYQHQTVKAYNILNAAYGPDSEHYGIPYPGIVVINNNGRITYKAFYEGYRQRVTVEALIQDLDDSSAKK